jgi:outer membrane protein assembly factor BamB
VDGPALILVAGGPEAVVVSVDKGTGRTLWKGGGTDGAGYAPPVAATLGGRNGYVIAALTTIRAVDAANGQTLWTFPWVNQWKVNAPTPVVAGDTVFVTSGYDRGCALLDGKTGRKIWENREISSHFSSPILHEGCLYTTSDPGRLVCMDVKTGKVKWSQPGFEKGGICAADGILIVQDGKNGNLAQVAISPDGYQELGRMKAPLGGQSWTAPILASGRLIIRNKEQLACLDLR